MARGTEAAYVDHARMMARVTLWLVVWCSIACFCIITFMRPTTWYSQNPDFTNIRNNMTIAFPGDVPVLTAETTKPDGTTTTVLVGRDVPLWAGGTAFPVTLQWGSVMCCALAVAGLQALAQGQRHHSSATTTSAFSAGMTKAWRMARRFGTTQLPPYRFWSWWCDGLNVFEAFLAATWIALAIVYLYYNISRKFDSIGANLTPPPSPPTPPPSPFTPPFPPPVRTNGTKAPATKAPRVVDLLSPLFGSQRMEAVGKATGEALRGLMITMFLPISRSNFLKHVAGTDFNTIVRMHRWTSWGVILITVAHSVIYMVKWGAEGTFSNDLSWQTTLLAKRNVCGLVGTIFALLIACTATTWCRVNYWHIFYRVHLLSAAGFVIFSLLHYNALVNWMMPGLVLYFIDRAGFRLWQTLKNWTRVGPQDVHVDGNMLTLRLTWHEAGGRAIATGQTLYIRCPSVSLFESHPFSVAEVVHSNGGAAHAVVHMFVGGPWTRAVCAKLQQGQSLRMQIEGPYMTQLDHLTPSSSVVIMIAGGVGVTPLLGLLRQYQRQLLGGDAAVPRVHLIWSSRSLANLRLLGQDLLEACCGVGPTATLAGAGKASQWLQADLYYTGFEQEQAKQSVALQAEAPATHAKSGIALGAPTSTSAPLRAAPMMRPLVYALCTLLGFFGAWAGLLTVSYWTGYKARTSAEGADYLTVAIVEFVLILVGAAVPVLAVLAISELVLPRWGTQAARQGTVHMNSLNRQGSDSDRTSSDEENDAKSARDEQMKVTDADVSQHAVGNPTWLSSAVTTLQVLPNYVLAPLSQSSAASMNLTRGRPDLSSAISSLAEQHAGQVDEVDVLVAGNDGMSDAVRHFCASHNLRRASNVPALHYKRVAFHH